MDFSDPFAGLTPERKLTREEILRALRVDVAAELDAINLYQAHIDSIDDPEVTRLIAHIRDEEKEHVAEFMAMINALDPTQKSMFAAEQTAEIEQGHTEVVAMDQAVVEEASDDQPADVAHEGTYLTVGSLIGKEQG